MGGFTVQITFGSLSSPGDGMVRITLLTQVKKERKERITSVWAPSLDPETGSPFFPKYNQWSLANLPTSHWQTLKSCAVRTPLGMSTGTHPHQEGARMGGFTVLILLGSLSSPGDSMVRISLLTQVGGAASNHHVHLCVGVR